EYFRKKPSMRHGSLNFLAKSEMERFVHPGTSDAANRARLHIARTANSTTLNII
ncbi:MAG: hypothetical protein HW396_364, partial [Candidatus Dadabacteria bacterium]|nr:hypothetical protein [Candidatus Dadabacteria bacterium]